MFMSSRFEPRITTPNHSVSQSCASSIVNALSKLTKQSLLVRVGTDFKLYGNLQELNALDVSKMLFINTLTHCVFNQRSILIY